MSFNGLNQLTILRLDHNALTKIDSGMWTGLQSLEYLGLTENYISTISPNAFSSLSHLSTLHLGKNYLPTVHGNMWVGLQSLECLRLHNNRLTEIPRDGFSNMPALESLDLGSNQLMTLRSDIIYLHNRPSRLYLGLVDNPLQCDSSLCWLKEAVENRKVEIYNRLRCANERYVFSYN